MDTGARLDAVRTWQELYGRLPSAYDWSRTHARRRGTVCRAAVARVEAEGAYTVSPSLFDLTTAASLAERMAQSALSNRGSLARLVDRVRAGGGAVLRGAALTLSVKARTELGDGVEVALTPGFAARDPHATLLDALRLLQAIAEPDDRPMILLIDAPASAGSPRSAHSSRSPSSWPRPSSPAGADTCRQLIDPAPG